MRVEKKRVSRVHQQYFLVWGLKVFTNVDYCCNSRAYITCFVMNCHSLLKSGNMLVSSVKVNLVVVAVLLLSYKYWNWNGWLVGGKVILMQRMVLHFHACIDISRKI